MCIYSSYVNPVNEPTVGMLEAIEELKRIEVSRIHLRGLYQRILSPVPKDYLQRHQLYIDIMKLGDINPMEGWKTVCRTLNKLEQMYKNRLAGLDYRTFESR